MLVQRVDRECVKLITVLCIHVSIYLFTVCLGKRWAATPALTWESITQSPTEGSLIESCHVQFLAAEVRWGMVESHPSSNYK